MSDLLGLVSFIFFIVFFVTVSFKLIKTRNESIQLKLQIIDLIQKNDLLKKALDSRDSGQVEKTEGFLNFITQSRDWAFEYIEDVQNGLTKFIKDIEPEIEYFKEYGDVVAMQPNYHSMKKITESYEDLKKLLPENEDKK